MQHQYDFLSLIVLLAIEDPQDSQEEVDDVEIERYRCGDLFLNVVVTHDKLCVHQDVRAEDKSSPYAVDQLHFAVVGEEGRHETEDDEHPETTKEIRHPRGEVVLALTCEHGKGDEDGRGDDEGFEHDFGLIEGDDDRDGVSLQRGEPAQEEKVGRI